MSSTGLISEIYRYLAVVDVFRQEGANPSWQHDSEPVSEPAQQQPYDQEQDQEPLPRLTCPDCGSTEFTESNVRMYPVDEPGAWVCTHFADCTECGHSIPLVWHDNDGNEGYYSPEGGE